MKHAGVGLEQSYNVHTAVDTNPQIIVAASFPTMQQIVAGEIRLTANRLSQPEAEPKPDAGRCLLS